MEKFDVIKERLINGKAFGSVASSPEIGAKYSDMDEITVHLTNCIIQNLLTFFSHKTFVKSGAWCHDLVFSEM